MYQEVIIDREGVKLKGRISNIKNPRAWVIFAHGTGSSRKSPRNNWVADELNKNGFGTLLFDLLTIEEDLDYENRFNVPLLAERLSIATNWLVENQNYEGSPIAYFGASTGVAASLVAAAEDISDIAIYTVIGRGGRPDLAEDEYLSKVKIPVLFIVGELDHDVLTLNKKAAKKINDVELALVKGATHLFEESGALREVVNLSLEWLERYLPKKESEVVEIGI